MESKNYVIIGAILIIAAVLAFSAESIFAKNTPNAGQYTASQQNAQIAQNTQNNGQVQEVTLTVVGGNYILTPSTLKKDVPVKMTVDLNSVVGCARGIVINDFGVRKGVRQGDNVIEFIPNKAGTFGIQCTMNMYRGTFTVTDDGTPVNTNANTNAATGNVVNTQSPSINTNAGKTCGANGGGCGCGGSV